MGRASRKGVSPSLPREPSIPTQDDLRQMIGEIAEATLQAADDSMIPESVMPEEMRERLQQARERRQGKIREMLALWKSNLPRREWTAAECEYIYCKLLEIGERAGHPASQQAIQDMCRENPGLEEEVPPERIPSVVYILRNINNIPDTPSGDLLRQAITDAAGGESLRTVAARDYFEAENLAAIMAVAITGADDPRIGPAEDALRENLEEALRQSQIKDRVAAQPALVMSGQSNWIMEKGILGICNRGLPGNPQAQVPIVFANSIEQVESVLNNKIESLRDEEDSQEILPPLGKVYIIDETLLNSVAVHELIHSNQDLQGEAPEGWEDSEVSALVEGLTEGLVVLRKSSPTGKLQDALRIRPVTIFPDGIIRRPDPKLFPLVSSFSYPAEVTALFGMFQDAGIPAREFEDRIELLHTLPIREAVQTIEDWLGSDFREDFLGRRDAYQREDMGKVHKIFSSLRAT